MRRGNATYGDILENEDRCFNRRSRDAGEHVCARCNEARDGEHALVFVVIDQARAVSVEQWAACSDDPRDANASHAW